MSAGPRIELRPLGYALGAEVKGVDVSRPLDDAALAALRQRLADHIVLCFPQQEVSAEQLIAFAAGFGEVDDNARSPHNRLADLPKAMLLSNKTIQFNGKEAGGYKNGDYWHSDFSSKESPTTLTFLAAKELPSVGGDTLFVNMYMAYETLSAGMKRLIDPLDGIHDVGLASVTRRMGPEQQLAARRRSPLVCHPLVRIHPETGRKALYLNDLVGRIAGMTEEESKPLLVFLMKHALSYEFMYRHRWTKNDVLMWDNRCSQHCAVQDYDPNEMRWLLRCSLRGPQLGRLLSESAYAAEDPVPVS